MLVSIKEIRPNRHILQLRNMCRSVPMLASSSADQRLPFREQARAIAGVFPEDTHARVVVVPAEALEEVAFEEVAALRPAERPSVTSPGCQNGLAQVGRACLARSRLGV